MSISDKVTDWEITHIAQVGGAATVGGGVYFFEFKSKEAGVRELFTFGGAGIGLGGSIGGGTLDGSPCVVVECLPFSALDLHGCWGIAVAGGVSVGAGIGAGTFAAKRTNASGVEEVLFLAAEAGGQSGVALGGSSLVGRWCYVDRFIDDYIAQPITSAGRWMQDVVQSALD